LRILDFYYLESSKYSKDGKPNVGITCRHFGIHRSYFYRWKNRYKKWDLTTLENRSTKPKHLRKPTYSRDLVAEVRRIRKENPSYSAKKIVPILLRTRPKVPSVSTIGRLITRENLFFRVDVDKHRKRARKARQTHVRLKKPYGLKAESARQIIEFDMKHISMHGSKQYAFVGVDPLTKEAVIHIGSTPSSANAKAGLARIVKRFGTDIKVVSDNGSENMGDAAAFLRELGVTQYWTKPNTPKDKPFVERLIGTLQTECLDYHYEALNTRELSKIVDEWLDKYHFYRPHESLDFKTPGEYCASLGITIPHVAAGVL